MRPYNHNEEAKGGYHPGAIDIQLAVGLPPAHYGTQYQQFCAFFLNRGPIHFEYHSRKYSVVISKAVCYPQSYAAAITMFQALKRIPRALILDIGGVTVDYMQIKNGGSDMSVSDSLESGVIMMYNRIVSKVRAEHDIILSEPEIDAILLGQNVQTTPEIIQLTERLAQEFILDLFQCAAGASVGAALLADRIRRCQRRPIESFHVLDDRSEAFRVSVLHIQANLRGSIFHYHSPLMWLTFCISIHTKQSGSRKCALRLFRRV